LIFVEEDALERLRITQNELNQQGASDLVVELFMSESPVNILEECINLAIALLEGGNTEVQVGFFQIFFVLSQRKESFLFCLDKHISSSSRFGSSFGKILSSFL